MRYAMPAIAAASQVLLTDETAGRRSDRSSSAESAAVLTTTPSVDALRVLGAAAAVADSRVPRDGRLSPSAAPTARNSSILKSACISGVVDSKTSCLFSQ